jgi:hypothetical protein
MKEIEYEPPTEPDVHWELWVDPYIQDSVSGHDEDDDDDDDEDYDDLDEDDDLEGIESLANLIESNKQVKRAAKLILTPSGAVPISDSFFASYYFKLWMGHTNFKLRKKHVIMIDQINGVESVDIITNHRFRVGIGKLFKDRDVMANIRDTLVKDVLGD